MPDERALLPQHTESQDRALASMNRPATLHAESEALCNTSARATNARRLRCYSRISSASLNWIACAYEAAAVPATNSRWLLRFKIYDASLS